jgi:4-amino-4-deoxy-L-arabinose transferase-like glycosyltransferase
LPANLRFTEPLIKKILITIFFIALILRVIAIFFVGDAQLDHEYATLVPNLLNGRGFSYYSMTQDGIVTNEYVSDPVIVMPSAFKPPIYSLMVAASGFLFGVGPIGIFIIEVLQAFVGAITCWLIYDVARLKFGRETAIWAFLMAGIFPLLAFSSAQISDVTLQIFLRCFFYWLLFKLEENPTSKTIIFLSGLTMGMLFTARTEMLLYIPVVLLWMIWVFKDRWLRIFAPMMAIAFMVIAPWVIRNYIQFNTITLNTSGGLNLWEGQNEQAQGIPSWYTDPSAELSDEAEAEIAQLTPTKDYEIKLDDIYFREAKEFMLSHPALVVQLAIKKFFFYWAAVYPGIDFIYGNADSPFYWLPWFLILPFFIYGLLLNLKFLRQHFLFHANFLLGSLTVMVFFVLPKYIVFVIPWVFIFAASALSRISGQIREGRLLVKSR